MSKPVLIDHLCDIAHSQLVVVDIQTRLAAAMAEADRQRVIRNAAILTQAAGLLEIPTIASEQYAKGLGPTEEAVAWHFPKDFTAVDKTCFSCCGHEPFLSALAANRRQQVVLTGMESHVCVLQTAIELQSDGYQVFVVSDAVCARSPENHRNALRRMAGVGVVVTNTESVLFEWLRDARHPRFKDISALIK